MFRAKEVRTRVTALMGRLGIAPAAGRPVVESLERIDQAIHALQLDRQTSMSEANRLRSVLDTLTQGIVVADPNGDVLWRNRSAAAFVEARHGDALVGSAIGELVAAAVGGRTVQRDVELFGPPRRVFRISAGPLSSAGEGTSPPTEGGATQGISDLGLEPEVLVLVDDISEQLRLESVRRDFVANVSHELKTPIGALGVLSEALAGDGDPATVERLAARIQTEAFRLAHTVDDLLQLGQIEASAETEAVLVYVGELVEAAIERTAATADLAGVAVTVFPVAGDLSVVGDRRQLVSALANLLENAVKYSEPGSEVEVQARSLDGGGPADGGPMVEIEVTDHGIGIPASDLERVFERFYRVDPARSRDTGGTGLGLAIVRHVAQRHGGEVTVRSVEGVGSTFALRFRSSMEERS